MADQYRENREGMQITVVNVAFIVELSEVQYIVILYSKKLPSLTTPL